MMNTDELFFEQLDNEKRILAQAKRIKLTPDECKKCDIFAELCFNEAKAQGKKNRYGCTDESPNYVAARGEQACANVLGVPNPFRHNQYKDGEPDLGIKTEVRTRQKYYPLTPGIQPQRLIIREGDHPDRQFVLVYPTECEDEFLVVGWVFGVEGMKAKYWGRPDPDRPACWNAPVKILRPLDTLTTI